MSYTGRLPHSRREGITPDLDSMLEPPQKTVQQELQTQRPTLCVRLIRSDDVAMLGLLQLFEYTEKEIKVTAAFNQNKAIELCTPATYKELVLTVAPSGAEVGYKGSFLVTSIRILGMQGTLVVVETTFCSNPLKKNT